VPKLNFDALNNAPLEEVALTAFLIINAVQGERPERRAAAAAMVFLLLCQEFGADPAEVFRATKNMMASDEDGANPHFEAVKLYIHHEARQ
jgi:hypothetical protein